MRHTTAAQTATTRSPGLYRPALSDLELYQRGTETLIATWTEYGRGATDAAVHRFAGVSVAAFPYQPERDVYNNAVLERDLAAAERAAAIAAMEAAYETAGITRFAAWVHESDG